MSLPDLTADGVLPLGAHEATWDEIEEAFVTGAPFWEARALIFDALRVYARLIWARFPDAVLWVDGGFVTHKSWAAPHDVDVAVVVPNAVGYDPAAEPDGPSLWTLLDVSAARPSVTSHEKVQPMGGLVDGFFVQAENGPLVSFWHGWWQRRRQESGPDLIDAKGFLEVRNA